MSRVFVDTSAVLALLNPSDESHEPARRIFGRLQAREAPLLTTSFALVEIYALLGRRLGLSAVEAFRKDFAPILEVVWVDPACTRPAWTSCSSDACETSHWWMPSRFS